jgi:hypothetical protein
VGRAVPDGGDGQPVGSWPSSQVSLLQGLGQESDYLYLLTFRGGKWLSHKLVTSNLSISKKLLGRNSEKFLHMPKKSLENQSTDVDQQRKRKTRLLWSWCLT